MNTRPKFATTYTVWSNENIVSQGTLEEFQEMILRKSGFSPKTDTSLVDWVRSCGYKLEKQFKRSRKIVTVVLFDPYKPERIEFLKATYGKKKGKRTTALKYTDPEGNSYSFYLNYQRGTHFAKDAPNTHKREVTMHILEKLYKAINGEDVPEESNP